MSAREEILARVRTALRDAPPPPDVPREHRTSDDRPREALLDLLVDRLEDYRAVVRRCDPAALAPTVSGALREVGASRVGVPVTLDVTLDAPDVVVDDGLAPGQLDRLDAAVTRSRVAVAETGTIVLDPATAGRRALTLVPDVHVCIVDAADVVGSVPEAVTRLANVDGPLTWVSGPSATSDIELSRVEGVHGPRTLVVVLVEPPDRE